MYVVDASVWVSGFFPTDSAHEVSLRWLGAIIESGANAFAPALVLPEVAGAIARRSGATEMGVEAADQLTSLPTLQIVILDTEIAALSTRLAAELRLRGADAVYVALARRLGMSLVTWDAEQRERAGQVVRAMTPEEALRL
ncbi:MAG: PIN domain-containing protein [Dehalococcoidia bacterium]|nr:PIN domain-containing protein [Dehalococcoidia bacterium]